MKPLDRSARILAPLLALGLATPGLAQTSPERLLHQPVLRADRAASLEQPQRVAGALQAASGPVWTAQGLWQARPAGLHGLQGVLDATPANDPVWDPSSRAWYAWVYGALVRVEPEGSLPVILESLPGHDFDVRAARGLVVYRDPDRDQIVLVPLADPAARRVLLAGDYYNPRFSPDGTRVAVSQLRNGGGHLWLLDTASGAARDLGKGYDPAWRPDGRQLLFVRLDDNGHELTGSHVLVHELGSHRTRPLASARSHLVTRPTFSPDGSWIAFVDEVSGQLMASRLSEIGGAR